jgi:hypothetical protein
VPFGGVVFMNLMCSRKKMWDDIVVRRGAWSRITLGHVSYLLPRLVDLRRDRRSREKDRETGAREGRGQT